MSNKGLRILFVGNSITWHPVKKEIGWFNEWGMAASAEEKDFVHLVMNDIHTHDTHAVFDIAWVVEWERNYKEDSLLINYKEAVEFNPDIIIVKIGENVNRELNYEYPFYDYYKKLIDYFNPLNSAKVIIVNSFWDKGSLEDAMRLVSKEREYPLVDLGNLREQPGMKAIGLFEHSGVANHPGDKGMKAIADAILIPLKQILGI